MNLTLEFRRTISQRGFTLLELMSVIAIVSILVGVSYPAYTNHVIKSNRAQAHIALLSMAAGMERYHALNHRYTGATLQHLEMGAYTKNQHYRLEIEHAGEDVYKVKAIPQGAQYGDVLCGVLGLDERGRKNASGTGSLMECW